MKTAVLVLKMAKTVPYRENVDYIGVDAGTLVCLREHLPVTYAVGDFDSVNQEQWEYIQKMVPQIEKLNPIKDDSDSEHAIKRALREGYERIEIYGGLGGRVDHEIVNIRLACAYPEKVYLMSKKNELYAVREGTYIFSKLDSRFISFLPIQKPLSP